LKLDGSSYNEVLNKPNKFTVIKDDEYVDEEEGEVKEIEEKAEEEEDEEDDILVIEWTSLINVKVFPKKEEESVVVEEIQDEANPLVEEEKLDEVNPVEGDQN